MLWSGTGYEERSSQGFGTADVTTVGYSKCLGLWVFIQEIDRIVPLLAASFYSHEPCIHPFVVFYGRESGLWRIVFACPRYQ